MNQLVERTVVQGKPFPFRNKPSVLAAEIREYVLKKGKGEAFTSEAVAERTGASIHTVRDVFTAMRNEGVIRKAGSPRWGLTWEKVV